MLSITDVDSEDSDCAFTLSSLSVSERVDVKGMSERVKVIENLFTHDEDEKMSKSSSSKCCPPPPVTV